jgi:UDPglucose 6-dehydrogenase
VRRVTVIGTGYLGTTNAACLAELGWDVLGMDVDAGRIAELTAGRVPFYEPGLGDLLSKHVASGRLRFTTSYADVAAFGGPERGSTVHFICVNTPQQAGGHAADLRSLDAVADGLAPLLDQPTVVVGKSTAPVGTAARLAARFATFAPAGQGVELAWNPEFLREGHAVADTLRPDRIVVGAGKGRAQAALAEIYAALIRDGVPLVATDLATAELAKNAANAFLATKISFINAMAELCEAAGGDVLRLAEALSYDPRIGGSFLMPGLGFGGGCLPKDIRAFTASARELGVGAALGFLREVDSINLRRRVRTADLAREECGGSFSGKRIAVWGAAFKPDSDDVRDSPALDVAASIRRQGGRVAVYDPKANGNAARLQPDLDYAESALEAAEGADVLLHLTQWREFRELDPAVVAAHVRAPRIVDGRNALDAEAWRKAGWHYRAPGRPDA